LVPLRSLPGYRLADGEPDIHGWPLIAADGRPLGVVEELLVDPASSDVAALAVAPRGARAGEVAVLPMTAAQIDADARRVTADLTPDEFARLPHGGTRRGRSVAAPATGGRSGRAPAAAAPAPRSSTTSDAATHPGVTVERTADGEEIVRVPVVEEELVVERRPVVKEVVVIRKRAVPTERVIEADLRRERVHVEHVEHVERPDDPDRRDAH
jgi:hypothetical protein